MFKDCINHTSREWPHVQSQEHTHNSNPIPGPEESAGAKESGEARCMSCLCFACCCFVKLWARDLQASVATCIYRHIQALYYIIHLSCVLILATYHSHATRLEDYQNPLQSDLSYWYSNTRKQVISTIQNLLIFSHLTNP